MSFFPVLILVILASIGSRSLLILNEFERGVRYRLGRYIGIVGPGLNFLYPGIDAVEVVDMRVKTLDVPKQALITKDNAAVTVDAFLYYQPVAPDLLLLRVKDFEYAIVQLAQTTMRSIVGGLAFDEAISQRERINTELMDQLEHMAEMWGARIIAIEVRELLPASRALMNAMNMQISGERNKRAMILVAEGAKLSQIMHAEGEQISLRIQADGAKTATVNLAQGEAKALGTVALAAEGITGPAMSLWQMGMLKEVGSSKGSTLVLPYHMSDLTKAFRGIEGTRGE